MIYIAPVRTIISRLLLLVAVLLMPFGMAPAAASASPVDRHATMAAMATEHCPDQSGKHEKGRGFAMCSMACASALPAQELAREELPLRHHQHATPMMTRALRGVPPEIATPPPRHA